MIILRSKIGSVQQYGGSAQFGDYLDDSPPAGRQGFQVQDKVCLSGAVDSPLFNIILWLSPTLLSTLRDAYQVQSSSMEDPPCS
jgi:hypothetical protein